MLQYLRSLLLCACVLVLPYLGQSQTVPRPLAINNIFNITSASQVIDNRSITQSCNVYTFNVSGSGTWSVQMEYSDTSANGPWSQFGSTALITNTQNPSIGIGYGYHNWVRFNTLVGATNTSFSCEKNFWVPSGSSGVSCPNCYQGGPFIGMAAIPGNIPDASITRNSPSVIALGNGTQGDASASVIAGSFTGDGSNLTYLAGYPASVSVNLGRLVTDMGIHALSCGISTLITDNLAAFQCAVSNASSLGTGQVFVPAGTYQISNTLDIPNKVRILGVGRGDIGPIGSGGMNTVIQANSNFPTNGSPLIRIGQNVTQDAHFGSGIENLTIDCNNRATTGLQELFGEEQTRNRHLLIQNCSAFGYQIMGADNPSTGASQNSGPDEDIEIYPAAAASASTVDLDIENGQDLRPLTGFTLNNTGPTFPTYCAKVSGNGLQLQSIHMEGCGLNGAGILVGGPGTKGMRGLVLNNPDLTTNRQGPVVQIYNNTVNAPAGIIISGAQGGTYGIQNDPSNVQSNSLYYAIGSGSAGVLPVLSLAQNDYWANYSFFFQQNQEQILSTVCPQLAIKYSDGFFPGFPFCVNATGDLNLGMQNTFSSGNLLFTNHYNLFSLSASPTINSLTLQGAVVDPNNSIQTMIGDDIFWNEIPLRYSVTGNGSNAVNAIRTINGGGIDFISANQVADATNYTEAQVTGWRRMLITPGSGIDIPTQNTPSGAPANGFIRFYGKNNGICSMTSGFVETCYGSGGGGGGGSTILSNVTPASASNSINNGNFPQAWNWNLTTNNTSAFTVGENLASTATGSTLLNVNSLAGSSSNPVTFTAAGLVNGVTMDTTGNLKPIGTGNITASSTTLTMNTTSPLSGGGPLNANITLSCPSCVFSNSSSLPVNAVVIGAGTLGVSPLSIDAVTTHAMFSGGSSAPPVFRTIASSDLPTATVYNNQANTFVSGLQDLSAATLKVPVTNGASPTIAGMLQYDSSSNNIFFGNGSQTNKTGWFTGTAPVSNNCVKWGSNGQLQDFGSVCGGSGSSTSLSNITAASSTNAIDNANFPQSWEWDLTTNSTSGQTFTESVASTATTSNLVNIKTLATSTLNPLIVTAGGTANGAKMDTTGLLQAIGTGGIKATTTSLTVSTTSPVTGGGALTTNLTLACATCVTSAASLTDHALVVGSGGGQGSATIGADTTTTHALFATATNPAFRAMVTSDLPATTVSTNQANAYSTGLQDFSLVTLKAPIAAGATPTTAGLIQYDSTSNNIFFGNGSQTNKTGWFTGSAPVSNNCVKWGSNGQLQDFGSVCGGSGSSTALSNLTDAVATNTLSSANFPQIWRWSLTTNSTNAMALTESTASTATSSSLLNVKTLSTSTLNPVTITAGGTANGVQMSTAGVLAPIGTGGITANSTSLNVNTTGPLTGGGTLNANLTLACATCVTAASALTSNAVVIGGGSQASATIPADTNTAHALFATATSPAFRSIASGDLPSAVVYNSQANAYTTGLQDFSAATIKAPIATGAIPTVAGLLQYDSTTNDLFFGNGTQTNKLSWFTGTSPVSGNCVKWGSNGQLQDVGSTCGTGGGGSITINGVSGSTFNLPTAVSGNGNTVVQNGSGPSATIQYNRTDTFRNVTSGSDTVAGTDGGNTVYVTTGGAVAEALPQPTFGGTYLGFTVTLDVKNAGGLVTVTPSNSSINGGTAGVGFTMNPSVSGLRKCMFKAVDNTNWRTYCYDDSGSGGGGGGGGTTLTVGAYSALPATCTTGQVYNITSGGYDYAVCTGTNVWTVYAAGATLTLPGNLSLSSNSYSTGNQLSITQGYETVQITGNGAGTVAGTFRYWTAPGTPYTSYVFLNVPVFADTNNYRLWSTGFEDVAGNRQALECGVGASSFTGLSCRIETINSSNVDQAQQAQFFPMPTPLSGRVIIALQDDGTNIYWKACTRIGSCTTFFATGRTSFLSSPSRQFYGFVNTGGATAGAMSVDFLGVN